MAAIAKVLVALLHFSPLLSAASCDSGVCVEDDTSLIQVKQLVDVGAHRQPVTTQTSSTVVTQTQGVSGGTDAYDSSFDTGNNTAVEDAQNHVKAARMNSSVAKYALARANVNKAHAIYNALKASFHVEDADFDSTDAGRVAKNAIQTAVKEELSWKRAQDAEGDAAQEAHAAEHNQVGKHLALHAATAAANDATALREAAEENSTKIHIYAQEEVDRAAANESAYEAHAAKVEAAEAVATAKEADAEAKRDSAMAKEANHEARRSLNHAVHTEWHAAHHSHHAQWAEMKAAAADVDQEITEAVNASAFENMNFSLLQGLHDPDEFPVNSSTDLAMKKADVEVRAAEAVVSEAASDEKLAKEQQDVQKYAAKVADNDEKKAHMDHDMAKMKTYHADRLKAKAAKAAGKALEGDEAADAHFHNARIASAVADAMSDAAQNASAMREDAMLHAEAMLREARTKHHAAVATAKIQRIKDDAFDAEADATDHAVDAATSRAGSANASLQAENATLQAKASEALAKAADANATATVKRAREAEADAAHHASAYVNSRMKAAAANETVLAAAMTLPTDNTNAAAVAQAIAPTAITQAITQVTQKTTSSSTVTTR